MKLKLSVLAILFCWFSILPAKAQVSTLCVNCSNEVTQGLNYIELGAQTITAAKQLTAQITDFLTNTTKLPGSVSGAISQHFGVETTDLLRLYNAAATLSNSVRQSQSVFNGMLQGGVAMGVSPTEYQRYVAQQAQTVGGTYRQMFDDNNQRLRDLQRASTTFQAAAENVPNLQGNLDSLSQLNALAAANGNVATEMLAVNRQALAIRLDDKANEQAAIEAAAQMRQQRMSETDANLEALRTGLKANTRWR